MTTQQQKRRESFLAKRLTFAVSQGKQGTRQTARLARELAKNPTFLSFLARY